MITISCGQFCATDETINSAFIIGHKVYFGQNNYFYSYDLLTNKVNDQKQTKEELFGNKFKDIVSSVHFDLNDCSVDVKGKQYCDNVRHARDLVLVFGYFNDGNEDFGYQSFRLQPNQELSEIQNVSELVWGLKVKGFLSDHFWRLTNFGEYYGFTFDQMSDTLIIIGSNNNNKTTFYSKELHSNGLFETYFFRQEVNQYEGIFDILGNLYVLYPKDSKQTIIQRITKKGLNVDENEKYDIKTFFNCNGNSPLLKTSNTMTTLYVSESSSLIHNPYNQTKSSETVSQTDTTQTPIDSNSSSIYSRNETLLWILAIIISAIVISLIAITFAAIYSIKTTKGTENKTIDTYES